MKKLKGKISIGRYSGESSRTPFYIELEDTSSACRILEIEMSAEVFAYALTGLSCQPCEIELYESPHLGKAREVKQESVFVPDFPYYDRYKQSPERTKAEAIIAEAYAPFEVDGWQGHTDDARNSHRWLKDQPPNPDGKSGRWYSVSFERWVDPPTDPTP